MFRSSARVVVSAVGMTLSTPVLGVSALTASALGAKAQPLTRQSATQGTSRAVAASFSYAPGTRQYRLTTTVSRMQNQAGGRAPFEFTNTTTMDVTLTLAARTHDTLTLSLVVDTVSVSSDLDAPPANLSGYQHARLAGLVSPQGRIYAFDPPPGTADAPANLYRAFRRFLVPFPNADVGPGTAWSDTSTSTVKVGGFDTRTVSITTSKITSDTTYAGQRAWRVERTGTITISGDATAADRSVHLSGDGTMRALDYVSTGGVFLGETGAQTTQLQQSNPNEPGVESTPIQQTIKSKVDLRP
jgi:hypothetical protein